MEQISPFDNRYEMQRPVPNATAVLVLGILSIAGCLCYGGGLIFAIIALVLAANGRKAYNENRAAFTTSSYNNLNAGRVCAIIGLVMCLMYIILVVVIIATVGWETISNPEALKEWAESMKNQ